METSCRVMHRSKIVAIVLFTLIVQCDVARADANGGTTCAGCSIIIGLIEQLAQVHSTDVIDAAQRYLCANLPSPLDEGCNVLLENFGPAIIDGVYHNETPDIICHSIGLCRQDPGNDFCHLFPLPPNFDGAYERRNTKPSLRSSFSSVKGIEDHAVCSLPGIKEVCEKISSFADDHLPLQDKDGDRFSVDPTFRGTHWRGKDCDDSRPDFYPGRKPINHDRDEDSNCNGIFGVDPSSGVPYEDTYCSDETTTRGVVLLGDSAGAHFHIPSEYFMAETLSKETFRDVLMLLTNEFDWPMLSSVTAFAINEWNASIHGPVDSLYARFLNRNKCNHRDYQNIGVNGARSSSMNDIAKSLARNKTTDHPLFIVLALIGNDVCNGHPDTLAHMTTPADYKDSTMVTLKYLDETIPKGSTVIITGLADGRVLWNAMNSRYHPIGELNHDVTYKDLYTYLNCLEVSPCTGWMNSNDTIRDLTSQRAAELSEQAKSIAETEKFESFQLFYEDYDVKIVMDMWESRGGEAFQIIEPVDGFHPSQTGQALTAEYFYNRLNQNYPSTLGKVNPNNDKIMAQFGYQGGY